VTVEESGLVYKTIKEIREPILIVEGTKGVAYDEIVKIKVSTGEEVVGAVLDVSRDWAMIQVFGQTSGMDRDMQVRFTGETMKIPVSDELIGRVFDGSYQPLDGLPQILSTDVRDVNGGVINPAAREPPTEFIQTGISAIDGMNSLIRGQKLPIFSESGLPHNQLAAQIAREATIPGKEEQFAIVFAALGIKHEDAEFFQEEFKMTGALHKAVLILNLADDSPIERILTPRVAQTIAEYLAFDLNMHVLTILTDVTNYAEALRTISVARQEIPTRKGYPGYLYSDLATIYERAGRIAGKSGSLTLMPILTMPGGDITHPVPDLTGYITEGQIILQKDLYLKGIYPPINVLPSLSRLMKDGIGQNKTRKDHSDLSNQLYMAYAEGIQARSLVKITGTIGLSDRERTWLDFANQFEQKFINQPSNENRSIDETLQIAWDLMAILPEEDLIRIRREYITEFHPKYKG
jgi:V/A-type H+-transporting ATPase subunit B